MQYQLEFKLNGSEHCSPWVEPERARHIYGSLKERHIEIIALYKSPDGIHDKQRIKEDELLTG